MELCDEIPYIRRIQSERRLYSANLMKEPISLREVSLYKCPGGILVFLQYNTTVFSFKSYYLRALANFK